MLGLVTAVNAERHRLLPFRYRMQARTRLNKLRYGPTAVTRPLEVFWVSPDLIRYNGPTFSNEKYIGTIRRGDWDIDVNAFESERMYRGLRERFNDGLEWEATQYYQLAVEQFEANGEWLGYSSLEEFIANRLPYLDRLHATIDEHGYKPQSELSADHNDTRRHGTAPGYYMKCNEVACNIARDGELLLNNGIHRLSIAKILDLDEIPIQIIVRHTAWQEVRQAAAGFAYSEIRRGADSKETHPDLKHLVSSLENPHPVPS